MSLFEELKRRNVFRVGAAYLLVAWVLLQAIDFILDAIAAPNWILQVFILVAAVGFLVVLIFSWVFELTPEGIRREKDIDRTHSITPQTGHKLDRVIIVFLAVAVVLLLADRVWNKEIEKGPGTFSTAGKVASVANEAENVSGPNSASPFTPPGAATSSESAAETAANENTAAETSVAVLPFVNMSDDASNEYFSDGISEELLNVLVRVEGLRVPSRTSSFSFKGSDKKIAEIGRELQVDHVLEGSVRKAGDRIRVTAQLIDVNTDTHLWSETYTRQVDDIFAVQDEIAQAIVSALKVTLSGTEQSSLAQHSTDNVEAYNKYLLGRYLWNRRTTQSLLDAVAPLQEAVALDPRYDQAWAALADTYMLIPEYRGGAIEEYIPLARQAVERAMALNPDSARALATLANIKAQYDYDFAGANADFARAIELEPGYATAHQWYSEILTAQRRFDEALEQADLAIEADPQSVVVANAKGNVLLGVGRLDEAAALLQAVRVLDPQSPLPPQNLLLVYQMQGQYAQARILSAEVAQMHPYGFDGTADLALIDAMENPALKPRAIELIQQSPLMYDGADSRALYFALLGEYELAMDNLEMAFAARDPSAIYMNRWPTYDPLRDNPRFQALLQKMNLWPVAP